jgi:DNA-binding LacI/PurR family transcriptional regulator
MVRLREIATRAGVHVSTVSKALRNSGDLNEQTIKKIRDIASKLDYPIHAAKRPRKSGAARVVGVISPDIASNYYAQLVYSIQQNLAKMRLEVHVAFSNFNMAAELRSLETFLASGVAGIIYVTENCGVEENLRSPKVSSAASRRRTPLIVVAPHVEVDDFDYIRIDDTLAVTLAVQHLVSLGHRAIAYVGDRLSMDRLKVYKAILRKNGITPKSDLISIRSERFEKCGFQGMKELLSRHVNPTAAFAAYDDVAIGAIKAANSAGMKVPDDLSIVGIDDIQVCAYLSPQLTTVAGPIGELGRICAERISRKIDDREADMVQHITLKPKLVIRGSTKAVGAK